MAVSPEWVTAPAVTHAAEEPQCDLTMIAENFRGMIILSMVRCWWTLNFLIRTMRAAHDVAVPMASTDDRQAVHVFRLGFSPSFDFGMVEILGLLDEEQ